MNLLPQSVRRFISRLPLPPELQYDGQDLATAVDRVNAKPRTFDDGEPLSRELRAALAPKRMLIEPTSPPPASERELLAAVDNAINSERGTAVSDELALPPITALSGINEHRILAQQMIEEFDKMDNANRTALADENRRHTDAVEAETKRHREMTDAEDQAHNERVRELRTQSDELASKRAGYQALLKTLDPPPTPVSGGIITQQPASGSDGPETFARAIGLHPDTFKSEEQKAVERAAAPTPAGALANDHGTDPE